MTLHAYLLFVCASIVLVIVPGPDMLYMLGRCIAQGRRAGLMAAVGFNLGGYVHLTGAVLGLSAVLAASSFAFTLVKWIGAAYLVYLGITTLWNKQSPLNLDCSDLTRRDHRTILWQAFLSDVLNPKVAMFFLALLPQFVSARSAHPALQVLVLGLTLNVIALPMNCALVYFSSWITQALRRNQTVSAWLQKALGAMFVALGLRLAVQKV